MKAPLGAAPLGSSPDPASLAIGVFDGVHLGHREVLRRTLDEARQVGGVAVAVTFDRHPNVILAPDRNPPLLWPLWRRLEAFAALGFEAALVCVFDAAFSRQPAEAFVDGLTRGFRRVAVAVRGDDLRFRASPGGQRGSPAEAGDGAGIRVRASRRSNWAARW